MCLLATKYVLGSREWESSTNILVQRIFSGAPDEWFDKRGMMDLWAVPTYYLVGFWIHVIIITRRQRENPDSTVTNYSGFDEEPADHTVKEKIMAGSGSTDEEIPWITVVDPFFRKS
ncbi:uncharacterized protein EDB91DRAFT_1079489 [Suillus paluster]|uniref:uncharacterized protein n=1 Tax=Suillus paluster TaxID=48578 RepID=UPI001B886B20|nr:uncharacterized protein EDB91DRAFT_1079489 [Suillus paluster]KAG1747765.1 hypothetical protein EDB91DRAFT_1079489 [Suillus paluster]